MSFFVDDFNYENVVLAATRERARLREIKFANERREFETQVVSAFVNRLDFSPELVIPQETLPGIKIHIIEELDKKFPGRVEMLSVPSDTWIILRNNVCLSAFSSENIPSRIRIRCK